MICPKCGFDQPDDDLVCLRCGVIFAKIKESTQNVVDVEKCIKPSTKLLTVANILGSLSIVIAIIFFAFYLLDHAIEYS